jgi:starch synthase
VASDVAGLPEAVVDGVTGMLVPPADPAAVAGAIERLLGDPALGPVMGAASRRRALDRFDRSRAIHAVASLLLEAPRGAAGLGTDFADPGARLPMRTEGARQ